MNRVIICQYPPIWMLISVSIILVVDHAGPSLQKNLTMSSDTIRTEISEAHRCRTITTDHPMVENHDTVFGAAVCPHFGCRTPLNGNPRNFENTVFRCIGCNWIVVIDQEAINDL